MAKSQGQELFERIEAFITRYVNLPENVAAGNQAAILALWALHTWMYEQFSATPYLTVTASVKQAGKTVCMEVLALLCRQSQILATLRPLAIVRLITMHRGLCTVFVDEAEKLSGAAVGDLRSIFTTGYADGGEHMITDKDGVKLFRTYAPKCFALIGDAMDVVRDRSIVVHLQRAKPAEDFRGNKITARASADDIKAGIMAWAASRPQFQIVPPDFLDGRDREIWTPIFSVAAMLNLDRATMHRVTSAASDLVGLKGAEIRQFRDADAEAKAAASVMAERAIKDLASVFEDGEKAIWSADAVARMRAIAEGPWRTFRGVGLEQDTLAQLVKLFGVKTKSVAKGRGRGNQKFAMGYSREAVVAGVGMVGK